ncbi:MAG: glycosyltransferase family 9 protein [Massilibacteroides sp.]|nr:glycosyltransferase family 9 protein [Massilibacteroides sp.]
MANYLVLRFSAIGDVALSLPVVYSIAKRYSADTFTFVTTPFLVQLFVNRPPNIQLLCIDTKGKEKTFRGLLHFAFYLSKGPFDAILDLHDVLRTKVIDAVCKGRGIPTYVIQKGNAEKKKIITSDSLMPTPLRPMTVRYAEVFKKAGLDYDESFTSLFPTPLPKDETLALFTDTKKGPWIGIAPFAKHKGKIYPLNKMIKVVESLCKIEKAKVFLMGSKGREAEVLQQWTHYGALNVAGRFDLNQELLLMAQLDVMLSMDSANMHLASLTQTPVVSVWGSTHPSLGFYGYHQDLRTIVQREDLSCRPCSVYGNKKCRRGDWACLEGLAPERIVEVIKRVLK